MRSRRIEAWFLRYTRFFLLAFSPACTAARQGKIERQILILLFLSAIQAKASESKQKQANRAAFLLNPFPPSEGPTCLGSAQRTKQSDHFSFRSSKGFIDTKPERRKGLAPASSEPVSSEPVSSEPARPISCLALFSRTSPTVLFRLFSSSASKGVFSFGCRPSASLDRCLSSITGFGVRKQVSALPSSFPAAAPSLSLSAFKPKERAYNRSLPRRKYSGLPHLKRRRTCEISHLTGERLKLAIKLREGERQKKQRRAPIASCQHSNILGQKPESLL